MTISEAIEILKTYNQWRRSVDVPMPNPKQIGLAIDLIIAEIENVIR
jgi:hypothetical protein